MHADVSYRAALAYQQLTRVECRWNADGFHHDIEAVDLGVEVSAGRCANCGDVFAGRACVDRVGVWTGYHAFCKLKTSVGEVEESYASRGVEG